MSAELAALAEIDAACCTGCTQCKLVCPVRVIEQVGAVCVVQPEGCIRCGKCVWVCPSQCVTAGESADG